MLLRTRPGLRDCSACVFLALSQSVLDSFHHCGVLLLRGISMQGPGASETFCRRCPHPRRWEPVLRSSNLTEQYPINPGRTGSELFESGLLDQGLMVPQGSITNMCVHKTEDHSEAAVVSKPVGFQVESCKVPVEALCMSWLSLVACSLPLLIEDKPKFRIFRSWSACVQELER